MAARTPPMSTTIRDLEQALLRLPGRRRKLRAAAPRTIAALEKAVGQRLHRDLVSLLRWCGNTDAVLSLEDGSDWLSATRMRTTTRSLRKEEPAFPETLVPITTDGAGNYGCIDVKTGSIRDWDHETKRTTSLARSLPALLRSEVLKPATRAAREHEALRELRNRGSAAPSTSADSGSSPTKLRRIKRPDLTKLDRPGYAGGARAAKLLPDGRAVFGFQNVTKIWDIAGAKEIASIWQTSSGVAAHAASQRIVTEDYCELTLHDGADGTVVATWTAHEEPVRDVDIDPSGRLAVSCSSAGEIRLWDIATRKGLPRRLPESRWDVKKGRPLATLAGHEGIVSFCRVSPDGSMLLSGGWQDESVRLWDLDSRSLIGTWRAPQTVECGAFHPDGSSAVVGMEEGHVALIDNRARAIRTWQAHEYDVRAVAFASADRLVTASSCELALWDLEQREVVASHAIKSGNITGVEVLGATLLTLGPLRLYELR